MGLAGETCKGCVFEVRSECRRFPPTVVMYSNSDTGDRYPEVYFPWSGTRCGEYKEDEATTGEAQNFFTKP